jgi:uncharacterized protein YciI
METEYFVFIHRPGPKWIEGASIADQPLSGHFAYMTELEHDGSLIVGGGFLDGAGAMGVLRAESQAAAEQIAHADPAVRDGIVTTEVHPWFVTVTGAVAKS